MHLPVRAAAIFERVRHSLPGKLLVSRRSITCSTTLSHQPAGAPPRQSLEEASSFSCSSKPGPGGCPFDPRACTHPHPAPRHRTMELRRSAALPAFFSLFSPLLSFVLAPTPAPRSPAPPPRLLAGRFVLSALEMELPCESAQFISPPAEPMAGDGAPAAVAVGHLSCYEATT